MTPVWRIGYCENAHVPTATLLASLGFGSSLGSGRWHSKGPLQMVYAGSSRALCQLEKRIHANGAQPRHQALMRLELPDDAALTPVTELGLPPDWRSNEAATQLLGRNWLASGAGLGLWVPSFVEPLELNLLINPAHPQYRTIELVIERHPFEFDPRLF